ncbi:MAG: septum formation initiator family protein [Myxococcota bacterium]|nr:septum formation initiator family protein [Myxococcota bacterium]
MTASTGKEWLAQIAKLLLRRSLPLILVMTLAAAIYLVSELAIDTRLRTKNVELTYELGRVRAKVAQLSRQAETLRSEVQRLRNEPKEAVYHARTQLGMVRPGEIVYRFVNVRPEPKDQHR